MRITLNGNLGSGKSTVGKYLAAMLGIPYISTGSLFREFGKISNLDALQTNLAAEDNADIDFAVDRKIKELNISLPDFILDSRMAWHFVDNATNVFLSASPATAVKRVISDNDRFNESYDSAEVAVESLLRRRASEIKRYKRLYNVDIEDVTNYHLFIITDDVAVAEICDLIISLVAERNYKCWIPKARIVPMISIREAAGFDYLQRFVTTPNVPLKIALRDNFGFYFGRSRELILSFLGPTAFISFANALPQFIEPAVTDVLSLALSTLTNSHLCDWEEVAGRKLAFRALVEAN